MSCALSEGAGLSAGTPSRIPALSLSEGAVGSTGVTEGSVDWFDGPSVSVEALGTVGVTTSVAGAEESIGASSSADT